MKLRGPGDFIFPPFQLAREVDKKVRPGLPIMFINTDELTDSDFDHTPSLSLIH